MTRHGRNATNSAVYSYHERRKDASQSGYGTEAIRLSKDAIKPFDCCSLTLQPAKHPVVTVDGWLYEKEAILNYMLSKKRESEVRMREYEEARERERDRVARNADAESRSIEERMRDSDYYIGGDKSRKRRAEGDKGPVLPSFWLPSLTPDVKNKKKEEESEDKQKEQAERPGDSLSLMSRPSKTISCPMSGRPLKVKDLIPVNFTEVPNEGKESLVAREERYMCPVTKDVLRNTVPAVVLRPTGHVVTAECVDKIIRRDGMIHPLTGQKLTEKDIIPLQRGGTGYAAANELKAKKYRPNIELA